MWGLLISETNIQQVFFARNERNFWIFCVFSPLAHTDGCYRTTQSSVASRFFTSCSLFNKNCFPSAGIFLLPPKSYACCSTFPHSIKWAILLFYNTYFIYLFCRGLQYWIVHTYWSWRSLTKRARPKVMIIYKYQYEKEWMLKKMHCYWCLNNCTVREMERGERMGIIFSGGKGLLGLLNRTRTHPCKVCNFGDKGEIKKKQKTTKQHPTADFSDVRPYEQKHKQKILRLLAHHFIWCDLSPLK